MARACLLLDDFAGCEDAIRRGLQADAGNAALQKVAAELRLKQKKYEAKSRRVAGLVFEGSDAPEEPGAEAPGAETKAPAEAAKERELSRPRRAFDALREWFVWQIAVGCVVSTVLLAVVLTFLPKRQWPMVLIGFVMLVPTVVGMFTNWMGGEDGASEEVNARGAAKSKAE